MIKTYRSSDNLLYSEDSCEYDEHPNIYASIGFSIVGDIHTLTKNNMIKYTSKDFDGTIQTKFNYSYEYNEKNFPLKRTSIQHSQAGDIEFITLFEYSCMD